MLALAIKTNMEYGGLSSHILRNEQAFIYRLRVLRFSMRRKDTRKIIIEIRKQSKQLQQNNYDTSLQDVSILLNIYITGIFVILTEMPFLL